jgi:hypothetical protein
MPRPLRWITPLGFLLAAGAFLASPAAATAAGCLNHILCYRCTCDFMGVCRCTLCLPDCVLLLF